MDEIRASVDRAAKKLAIKYSQTPHDGEATEEFLHAVRSGQKFSFRDGRVRRVLNQAMQSDDRLFFARLGKALGKPSPRMFSLQLPSPVENFLLMHWAQPRNDLPELFYLTPEGLTDVLIHHLGIEELTTAAVVKIRQRLGLKAFTGQKKQVMRVAAKLKWLK